MLKVTDKCQLSLAIESLENGSYSIRVKSWMGENEWIAITSLEVNNVAQLINSRTNEATIVICRNVTNLNESFNRP